MGDQRSIKADGHVKQERIMDEELPQCKIKRNYSCNHCKYFTQNPRFHLSHLRDIHGERITINKCNLCLYASRHYQKLVRHMKMVHGSTDGIAGQLRKRASPERSACSQSKAPTPPLPPLLFPIEVPARSGNLSTDLELSRSTLKNIAALYFAENHIGEIMSQMEEADAALLPPTLGDESFEMEEKPPVSSLFDEIEESLTRVGDFQCPCGHVSKSFSENIVHRGACQSVRDRRFCETPSLSEVKCQHCHRRCKSTAELSNHLKNCLQSEVSQASKCNALGLAGTESQLWTRRVGLGSSEVDGDTHEIKEELTCPPGDEMGSVVYPLVKQEPVGSSFKKVFKCPRCPFWASTASRFHVHVVGHLNKKPFKCSLCTYRSNWRWDITKHIRLKSIRNPCHKNARVLMNDDTGRRNYTKYNKYLTLMEMNDEDGDSRLIKSGEMTPNQVASLGYLRGSSPSDLANDVAVTECGEESTEVALPNEKQRPSTDEKERVAFPIVKFSDDLVIDLRSNGLKRERFFSCRKCSYRHANRDAVLAHIRIHYQLIQRRGLPSKGDLRSSLQAGGHPGSNGVAAGISLSKDSKSRAHRAIKAVRGEGSPSQKTVAPSGDQNLLGATPSPTPPVSGSSFINDASKSAMLIDAITASNFCNTPAEKKVASPFRCGHCHQVSNWKHVIQRHCRLKHSGDIQIEAFDRSSDGRTPVYRAIDFSGSEQKRHSKGASADNVSVGGTKTQQQIPSFSDNPNTATEDKRVLQQPGSPVSSCNSRNTPPSPKTASKQHKSPSSPIVAQKPAQFKCTGQHSTSHESALDPKPSDIDKATPTSAVDRVEPTNRPKCPQRFINAPRKQKQCQESAGDGREVKSECDFSTNQETMLVSSEKVNQSVNWAKTNHTSTASKPIHAKNASKTKPVSTEASPMCSHSNLDSKNPISCPYCPIRNDCSRSFKSHLQKHLRAHSDFITPSKDDFDEHTRRHFRSTSSKSSPASHKSFDKPESTVDGNWEKKKKDEASQFKSTLVSKEEKKEKTANIRKRKCSTAEYTPAPVSAVHRTILFNPKTGQVIRRH